MNRLIVALCQAVVLGGITAVASSTRAASLPPPVSLNDAWQLQDIVKVSSTGDVISSTSYHPTDWNKATVPGTVLTSLVNDGVYPEPLYGENNRPDKIPDSLCRTSYWYRRTFDVPADYLGKHVWLRFDGVNYAAAVWVNGHEVGTLKGAFARGTFDVTATAVAGTTNAVAVEILPPPNPGIPAEQTIANGVGRNGGVTALDGPTFLCTIGWDWIPGVRDRDMGLWQGVTLIATGPVVIADPQVTSDLPLPRTDTADLTVATTLRNVTDQSVSGTLSGKADGIRFDQQVSLGPMETKTVVLTPSTTAALRVSHPRLWWPNGYGPQNLYRLHLEFDAGRSPSDSHDVSFGIRKITYFVPGSDNLTLSVNGVPVFCKGGDWGMDEAMKRISPDRLEAQVRMHKLANYTMIRNWVGQSTSEEFYDLCDKYGILVWDEFFQPNPSDGPDPADADLYLANVREKILRFRNHPSIALWCARNEGDPPPAIDAGIQKLMTELDPGRLYQHSSTAGHGVNSGGPYFWRAPREYYNFNEAFKTEIGSVSVPTLESVEGMMPRQDWQVINDDWAEHDLARGAQRGDDYPITLGNRYGPATNLADFVRKAQLMNYEAFRAMYEGRNAKLFHPATGVLTWMSNPAQPSFVWQLYSWDLEPNASLFATRKACEPVHIQMNQTDGHLLIINNTPEPMTGLTAKVSVFKLDGSVAYAHQDTVTAAASSATDVGPIAFPAELAEIHFVELELIDGRHHHVSDNFYWCEAVANSDDFQALDTLPLVTLSAHATRHDSGGKCLISVTLSNLSKSVALMAHVQLRRGKSGSRVLPVYYSENYVSFAPGERRTVEIEADRGDLHGDQPVIAVDGWNVTVKNIAVGGNGVDLAPNADALIVNVPKPVVVSPAPSEVSIDCGGETSGVYTFGAPPPSLAGRDFLGDGYYKGGNGYRRNPTIDVSAPNTVSEKVYQSERYGASTYTIPLATLPAGRAYTVRLHFSELSFSDRGKRTFNVDINGDRALTDFDIFAQAGARNKALVRDFPGVAPDKDGRINIALTNGANNQPCIAGIEIFPTP